MKRKFETNVASEIPKTKAKEPELPWKIRHADLDNINQGNGDLSSGVSPLRTRAIFLILLVLTIFTAKFYIITNIIIENEETRSDILRSQTETSALRANLEKMNLEKKALSENSVQLEKKVNELSAQKELFTSVIETLTKKGDEPEAVKSDDATAEKKEPLKNTNSATIPKNSGSALKNR